MVDPLAFENIVGQPSAQLLAHELIADSLPQVILLHGPRYAAKLSIALEIARGATCQGSDATWRCDCNACSQHRQLLYPYLILVGTRYFAEDISLCSRPLLRQPQPATAMLFVRAVRKLLRRFEPRLWRGEEKRFGTLGDRIVETDARLSTLLNNVTTLDDEALRTIVQTICTDTQRIAALLPMSGVPVGVIRNISLLTHYTADNRHVVIIENIDELHESAANALLKLLEEPPTGTVFILLTTRRELLLPTILSRARAYHCPERDPSVVADVLRRIFREETPTYESMSTYVNDVANVDAPDLLHMARAFVQAIEERDIEEETLNAIENALGTSEGAYRHARLFMEQLVGILVSRHRRVASARLSDLQLLDRIERYYYYIRQADHNIEMLNIGLRSTLTALLHSLRLTERLVDA